MTSDEETTWEYETVRPPREATKEEATDPVDVLNERGDEGWEFVETIDYSGGGTKYLVFKRPKRTDDDDGRRSGTDQ
ncbi:hypothetical protein HALLA_18220 [Halostagnicola larsenii XH-48]|uniref:DUF4177 domain-containing protein n=1 Tax=Halostagnicola larsenii XH-48 TaxID=797299 RepID=W0JPC7_9EURY|nr:DUF4177 domain-containing protein [Halostagnicola larsenii]AHG00444.1 hypothetical protein HALLA_18220 [Halostagnicola larsenii XH-48]